MYERMLEKQGTPAFNDLIRYSGESGALWQTLDKHLKVEYSATKQVRYPYGKKHGWAAKYSIKNKYVCDIFAENGAFTALIQISDKAMDTIYDELSTYAKNLWEAKTPCANGGWISFRVLDNDQLQDLKKILHAKITVKKK